MAFQMSNSGSDEGDGLPAMAEINIIPLVDVMLVLLIITMVTAPFLEQGVQIELPVTEGKNLQKETQKTEPVVLFISKDESIKVGSQNVRRDQVMKVVLEKLKGDRTKEVFVRADKSVPYGTVADIMARIQRAGIERVGLVTQPE